MDNEELTEQCKYIFGDIVVKAHFTSEHYDRYNVICTDLQNNYLDWSRATFIVEFINGAKVQFTNSEWASLERLQDADSQQT